MDVRVRGALVCSHACERKRMRVRVYVRVVYARLPHFVEDLSVEATVKLNK